MGQRQPHGAEPETQDGNIAVNAIVELLVAAKSNSGVSRRKSIVSQQSSVVEGYNTKEACKDGIELVKGCATASVVED